MIPHNELIEHYGANHIILQLTPFISASRQARIEQVLVNRLTSISLAMEAPSNPHNAAAIVRSAEVFGLARIHLIAGATGSLQVTRTTKGAFHWLDIDYHEQWQDFAATLQQQSVLLLGAAVAQNSCSLADIPITKPCCVVLGNEVQGLSSLAKSSCQQLFTIPMFGMSESLNLSVAAGIILHELSERRRAYLKTPGDLTPEQVIYERAKFYLRSLPTRFIQALFKFPPSQSHS